MSNHFLYVISSSLEGPCKIGISADPDRRLRQLQTGHPEPLKVFYREPIKAERVRLFETLVHRHMGYMRSHGEWFNLTVEQATQQIQWTIIHYIDKDDPSINNERNL